MCSLAVFLPAEAVKGMCFCYGSKIKGPRTIDPFSDTTKKRLPCLDLASGIGDVKMLETLIAFGIRRIAFYWHFSSVLSHNKGCARGAGEQCKAWRIKA